MDVGIAPLSLFLSLARTKPIGDESRPPQRERERGIHWRDTVLIGHRIHDCGFVPENGSNEQVLLPFLTADSANSADPNLD